VVVGVSAIKPTPLATPARNQNLGMALAHQPPDAGLMRVRRPATTRGEAITSGRWNIERIFTRHCLVMNFTIARVLG
jgi:hypothetical protein